MKKPLLIEGMHGMGDNLHQRAVIRQIIPTREVWLETSWPSIYHDLVGPDLKLLRRPINLRTQTKNAERERDKFVARPPNGMESMRIFYGGQQVMKTQSKTVLEAMCQTTGTSYEAADYRLPIPDEWTAKAQDVANRYGFDGSKPLLLYRPLVSRTEWRGCGARNANEIAYAHLFAYLRNHFFVVSIADLVRGVEELVGAKLKADVELHKGELDFETMAALFAYADLVFTSSGFACILAPAVGTPCINIVGGYEDGHTHDSGRRFAPMLSITPIKPCSCWTSTCRVQCSKEIDMIPAIDQLAKFTREHVGVEVLPMKGLASEMYEQGHPDPNKTPPLARPFTHPLYLYGPRRGQTA